MRDDGFDRGNLSRIIAGAVDALALRRGHAPAVKAIQDRIAAKRL
ncbi:MULTISPECIES: hypothetical protein [Sphingomonas]|nr:MULTISPECIES: hypothetical protein [Sphingomonas]